MPWICSCFYAYCFQGPSYDDFKQNLSHVAISRSCNFVLALLQVIVITVSGQTDAAKHVVSVSGQSQNNITVSKKKKATTMSKPQQEEEKKGKSTFTFTGGCSKEKLLNIMR